MMAKDQPVQSVVKGEIKSANLEAGCLYTIITDKRSVSRRNRASWYLRQLNKTIDCDNLKPNSNRSANKEDVEVENDDIELAAITSVDYPDVQNYNQIATANKNKFLVTPNTSILFLSRSIATSIILDLSPSIVSVSPQNDCVYLDSLFDALKRVLHLLVKSYEIPSSTNSRCELLQPKVFVSVIAYTPFVVAKSNQVLVQNRQISSLNIKQVLVELWICLDRLTQEIYDLSSGTCGMNLDFCTTTRSKKKVFLFGQSLNGGVIRQPGTVLDDIYELGLFSSSLMPRLSRLSIIVVTDGLFSSSNNLNVFRLKSIAVSFVSLGKEVSHPDACFGYTPYIDLMKFVSNSTQGTYISHRDLVNSSQFLMGGRPVSLLSNPLFMLFCWTLHTDIQERLPIQGKEYQQHVIEIHSDPDDIQLDQVARFFCVDQPVAAIRSKRCQDETKTGEDFNHDWRSFKQLDRNLDADFEQVLSSLLREGYLIDNIQFRHKETSKISARLVLYWKHNLYLEQELTASYWNNTDPLSENNQLRIMKPFDSPIYGDTYCEIFVHGSYSFLHNLYCDRRTKKRTEYRDLAYKQFRQLIDEVLQTHERLQYLSKFYRDSSLSKVPPFLLHGNSLLYEQPHTHRLTTTVDNVRSEAKTSDFQDYWQKISYLDTKSWKNLMHIHTLRLVLEHDQPKHKNIHCQNINGRYTHVQCRRAMSAVSNYIKGYASFALLEDTTYIKFIYNKDDNLDEIGTSATKGFIVIRINKLLPTLVIHLMFTSGILDSHRVEIVNYLEDQLVNCKLRNIRNPSNALTENILKLKTMLPSSDSCCVLIRSPLERMLKIYNRSFVSDYLAQNMAFGLPGSCPYSVQQSNRIFSGPGEGSSKNRAPDLTDKELNAEYDSENSINRYNLVLGRYLYGVRVVHTLANLPQDIVPSLISNVLSKISAILVNLRIKQGFHVAFGSSGIMNSVVELDMIDHSNEGHKSSCLCQCITFPPTVMNCSQALHSVLNTSTGVISSSKSGSLSGSLANSDGFMKNPQEPMSLDPDLRNENNSEIKIIKEYWIEQQYGTSTSSNSYDKSLENMRYPEIVDHLFVTDSTIFEYLMTYDILQLLCDKLSPYYELDGLFAKPQIKLDNIPSPIESIDSCKTEEPAPSVYLPSILIEGMGRGAQPRVPLLELEYNFSMVKFLDHCQQANLNLVLFRDQSEFYHLDQLDDSAQIVRPEPTNSTSNQPINMFGGSIRRKMSMDIGEHEHSKREHRSSYQLDCANTFTYMNPIYNSSLNQLFLDTLHKRLKQMHDKEFQLSEYDTKLLPHYFGRRLTSGVKKPYNTTNQPEDIEKSLLADLQEYSKDQDCSFMKQILANEIIEWKCFLRKGNQENLMIVFLPSSMTDINKWFNFVTSISGSASHSPKPTNEKVCPMFIFRCSSSMINEHVLSMFNYRQETSPLEADINLHFGQPCKYLKKLHAYNDEISTDILPTFPMIAVAQSSSDEKTLEAVHFRAYLRKIKNTVLKSRFSSLNEAYISELFLHKDDVLYYMNNVDQETQKKYHVSSHLKYLVDFIKSYETYIDTLPKEPGKPCDLLLNSILLQKCGLFINQPITRFNEANPMIKQIHDKKLLFMMRCNYKLDLPILEENLASSRFLQKYRSPETVNLPQSVSSNNSTTALSSSINESISISNSIPMASSLGRTEGIRLSDIKVSSVAGSIGSPSTDRHRISFTPRFSPNSSVVAYTMPNNDNVILEAFRGATSPIGEVHIPDDIDANGVDFTSLRHEAHMAEVLKQKSQRKESHQYRRVLKSKVNYNQSHGAIDQALKRVDSLGRLEHFCLTPLLFSPSWRTKLAPVRDHTIEPVRYQAFGSNEQVSINSRSSDSLTQTMGSKVVSKSDLQKKLEEHQQLQDADERWHQMVCNNYIKEYEQYIQTLGFNSVQIRYSMGARGFNTSASQGSNQLSKQPLSRKNSGQPSSSPIVRISKNTNTPVQTRGSITAINTTTNYNTGYLIKFLNCGCLVFKVGFCKPYVYSILYSIEGERFNNSNAKMNITTFLDELDNIKLTMHLHSFTYDYHLRSIYSFISGRQLTFSPGYHLISFVDDFRKYYQKAPNYARNQILSGEITIKDLRVCGQSLYNYIVANNTTYNLEVLEMNPSLSQLMASFNGRTYSESQNSDSEKVQELSQESKLARNLLNDYVLIELRREKVRYKDGKDLDIFDCGLLISCDHQQTTGQKNSLTLKYFLLFTNQRELYPKLVQPDDNIISLGCHKPIRLGVAQLVKPRLYRNRENSNRPNGSGHSDPEDLQSELQSSGEMSGPQSIISTANSIHSSSSGLQFGAPSIDEPITPTATTVIPTTLKASSSDLPEIKIDKTEESMRNSSGVTTNVGVIQEQVASSIDENFSVNGTDCDLSPAMRRRKRTISANSAGARTVNNGNGSSERAICDEEITYLGYFSSEEIDMLKFLQEKTASLKLHIERVVHMAEIHYRRDYLWNKLMQSNWNASTKTDELPLSTEELMELLDIVDAMDLATLDPQLSVFASMHINWYLKLIKSFADLKQSSLNQHRIYTVKTSKIHLLFMDPNCGSSFVLMSIDFERGTFEWNLMLKDKQQFLKTPEKSSKGSRDSSVPRGSVIELGDDCEKLITDLINFCASFMWSSILNS